MPKFLIERTIPGAGDLTADQLRDISRTSCAVIRDLGPDIQWVQSYVTGDKIYCIYVAPDERIIAEHAHQGGFPADVIARVVTMIEPVTAESPPAGPVRARLATTAV